MAADAALAAGMPLAKFRDETQAGLRAVLPVFAATANPVDITAALMTNSRLFSEILPIIASDPGADAVMVGVPVAGAAYDVPAFARDTAAFAAETGKPIAIAAPQPMVAGHFKATGLPVFPGETRAIKALDGFLRHHELMADIATRPPTIPVPPAPARPAALLNEADSLAVLLGAGVPVIRHRLCTSEDEAAAALQVLGGRVVVKGCSADVAHKSEHDLVRLNVTNDGAARAAFRDCKRILAQGQFRFDGVLLAPMVTARRELLIGAHRDPVFGVVVLIGDGGKYVEAMPDTIPLLPPFTAADVSAALRRLRIAPILAGVRGERPLDVAAYAAAVAAVAQLMLDDPAIARLDLNPVLVRSEGEGCLAIDAAIFRSGDAA